MGPDQWVSVELVNALEGYDALGEVDIVHDHTLAGPLLQRRDDVALATTMHWTLDGPLGRLYQRLGESVPLIAISRAQARSAPEVAVAAVIPHGIDARDFPVGDGRGGYCAFLGRMSPDKGVHLAIEACRRAGVPLRILARMHDRHEIAYFDEAVRPRLGGGIDYLGEARGADKRELLAGARALLVPAQWDEPFGLVMIEALACATPVIGFRRGSIPEVIDDGDTGYVCRDAVEMAEAIGRLDRIDRARCRAATEGRFSARRMVADHVALFERILERRVRP
jgi:glycosyltransferase involved in cell wall biosynthesis